MSVRWAKRSVRWRSVAGAASADAETPPHHGAVVAPRAPNCRQRRRDRSEDVSAGEGMLSLRKSVEWKAREGKSSISVKCEGLESPAGAEHGRLADGRETADERRGGDASFSHYQCFSAFIGGSSFMERRLTSRLPLTHRLKFHSSRPSKTVHGLRHHEI